MRFAAFRKLPGYKAARGMPSGLVCLDDDAVNIDGAARAAPLKVMLSRGKVYAADDGLAPLSGRRAYGQFVTACPHTVNPEAEL